ncbi:phBC6A51 family helix-turn-helix protein [Metabacillus sp. RGM 3146]|uniref:phBC6A51 family helix-turn-helix protein n=1 Tax=Metabacillus sp. RGM 3146 TaxID=3401092 RepID=UPI003B9C02BF
MATLTAEQHIAVKYLAQVKRGGLKQEEIAQECGVTRQTLYRWRKDPLFQQELKQEIVRNTQDRLPEIMDALADHAIKSGNAAAAKLILQANGMLTDKVEVIKPEVERSGIDYDAIDAEIDAAAKDFELN